MSLEFMVLSRSQAKRYAMQAHDTASIIISIYSSFESSLYLPRGSGNKIQATLPLCFDDVSGNEPFCMNQKQAQLIVNFLKRHMSQAQRLIVHCDAGVSRSAAICAAIMKKETGSDMPIFDSAKYRPNMHCYRLMLNELME